MAKLKTSTFIDSPMGKILFSVVLGLALASLFNLKCVNPQCKIYKLPENEDISNTKYKINDKCYYYK